MKRTIDKFVVFETKVVADKIIELFKHTESLTVEDIVKKLKEKKIVIDEVEVVDILRKLKSIEFIDFVEVV